MRRCIAFSPALVIAFWVAAQTRSVQVRINNHVLGAAVTADQQLRSNLVYVPFGVLQRAVDGADTRTRLQIDKSALYAVATGSCRGCALQVNRTVVISHSLQFRDGVPYLPLSDLLRALQGRLSVDKSNDVMTIHVGRCDWCILEPRH